MEPSGAGRKAWDLEPVMEVWVRPGDGRVTVAATGRLDAATADTLIRAYSDASTLGSTPAGADLLLDLTSIDEAAPAGLAALAAHIDRLRQDGVTVGVVGDASSGCGELI